MVKHAVESGAEPAVHRGPSADLFEVVGGVGGGVEVVVVLLELLRPVVVQHLRTARPDPTRGRTPASGCRGAGGRMTTRWGKDDAAGEEALHPNPTGRLAAGMWREGDMILEQVACLFCLCLGRGDRVMIGFQGPVGIIVYRVGAAVAKARGAMRGETCRFSPYSGLVRVMSARVCSMRETTLRGERAGRTSASRTPCPQYVL